MHRKAYELKTLQGKTLFLATDGESHAHGDTVQQAKSELRFKRLALKLQHEKLSMNTVLTVKMYRLLTGACNPGIQMFLEQNGIPYKVKNGEVSTKPMTLKDLLPKLEKANAYGLERIKSLIKE